MLSIDIQPAYISISDTVVTDIVQDYPKGDHFFYIQEGNFEYVTIWSRITGKAVVPRTRYDALYDVATSAPFASQTALRDFLRANFFIEQSGGSMATPTLKTITTSAVAYDDNSIFESAAHPLFVHSDEFGTIVEVSHGPDYIQIGPDAGDTGMLNIPCSRSRSMTLSYDAARITMNGGDMGTQMIDIHISASGTNPSKLNLQPGQVTLQASPDGAGEATLQIQGDLSYFEAATGDGRIELDTTGGAGASMITFTSNKITVTALKTSVVAPAQSGVIFPVATDENGVLSFVTKFVSQAGLPKFEWAAAATLPGPSTADTTTSEEPLLFGTNCAFMIQGEESTIGPWKSEVAGTAFSAHTIAGYMRVAIKNPDGTLNRMVKIPFVEEVLPVSP